MDLSVLVVLALLAWPIVRDEFVYHVVRPYRQWRNSPNAARYWRIRS